MLTVKQNYISMFTTLLRSTVGLGLKPQFYKQLCMRDLVGNLTHVLSRTCLSICRVKEREGALFRGCFRNSDALF